MLAFPKKYNASPGEKVAPVRTAAPGQVLFAGEQRGYGNLVLVEHANGLITLYAHNRDVRVSTGQTVREGLVEGVAGHAAGLLGGAAQVARETGDVGQSGGQPPAPDWPTKR